LAGFFTVFAFFSAAGTSGPASQEPPQKEHTMKHLFYAAGLFAIVASSYSYGQSASYSQKVTAQIPFDFQTGDVFMPAGKYIISKTGDLLTVRGESGKPSAMLLTAPAPSPRKIATSCLTFNRYNDDYFLTKIWNEDSREGRVVPKGKREKELARRLTFAKSDNVAQQTINLPTYGK
jgi:hypothetical protein